MRRRKEENGRRFADKVLYKMSESVIRTEEHVMNLEKNTKDLPVIARQAHESWEAIYGEGKIRVRVGVLERWRFYVLGGVAVMLLVVGFYLKMNGKL